MVLHRILIVESDPTWINFFQNNLPCTYKLLTAKNEIEAERVINISAESIEFVVVNSCIPHRATTTTKAVELIKKIKERFKGFIIATGAIPEHRNQLATLGCTPAAPKEVFSIISQMLDKKPGPA